MSDEGRWYETFFGGLYGRVLAAQFDESETLDQARAVRRVLGLRRSRRVLDVPCGMGRLTLPLARSGLEMTGVDLTGGYIRRARRAARREGLDVRFITSDMREIAFDAEFDAAFNWFGSFGYFSDDDNLAFGRRVFAALKPGGRFAVEALNKSRLLRVLHPEGGTPGGQTIGGVHVTHSVHFDETAGRIHDTWTMSRGKTTEVRSISIRLFNGAEMRSLLRAAGFREIRLYGYPPLSRFTRHSRRLIAVGRRPAARRGRLRAAYDG